MCGRRLLCGVSLVAVLATAAAGCGGSSSAKSSKPAKAGAGTEAAQAAAGDIPDNQVFLTYRDPRLGYRLKYPEGWSQAGAAAKVSFTEKGNSIRLSVRKGAAPTPASALASLRGSTAGVKAGKASTVTLPHGRAVKVTYTVPGQADPVTGKRPLLVVDRYVFAKGGGVAILDLAAPKGVDNVDAYRLISRSFAWR